MKAVGITDIGLYRKRNEDCYLIDEDKHLYVVCDGMGGHKGGDVASSLAVETIRNIFMSESNEKIEISLINAINIANQSILEKGKNNFDLNEMGTTVTAAVIIENSMIVAHVGDSSLFIANGDTIRKITTDHTLAEQMLRDGLLKREDMRANAYNHVLTRALGVEAQVEIDIYEEEVHSGDWIVICTDGLTDLLDDSDILTHIKSEGDPDNAAKKLVQEALQRGGYDNVTVVLLRI